MSISLKDEAIYTDTSLSCWIITFDSLGGAHRAVLSRLTRWLHCEAKDKKGVTFTMPDAQYREARVRGVPRGIPQLTAAQVPQQPNFSDCGLFLIHYAKQLLENQAEILQFIEVLPLKYRTSLCSRWRSEERLILEIMIKTSTMTIYDASGPPTGYRI